ncbi:MAG: tripartite tricarboxylate transporter substrate binding protein [Alphaproteobacteria bacterium]|nr:tripartite tricarboxylate transporter substrate binding protein [Alphaproteobacteria bacterium]
MPSRLILAVLALLLAGPAAAQQPYPTRTVRVIVPFAAGGGADVVARAITQKLSERLGQQFFVDNRPGASGNIGTEIAARAPADGHTVIVVGPNHTTNPALFTSLPFDPVKDFAPVSLLTAAPYILVVHPAVAATNLKDLIALARAQPGKIDYGTTGNGSAGHLAMEIIRTAARIDMVHVPYKGSPPMLADLIAGQVSLAFDNVLSSAPHIQAGRLRALATSAIRRTPFFPDTPTVAEASGEPGLVNFDVTVWQAMLAPAGTPPEIVALLSRETQAALAAPDLTQRLAELGVEVKASDPAGLAAFIAADLAKWATVVREAGAKLD